MAVAGNRRFKSGVVLATLALCAFFLAEGATALIGANVLQRDPDARPLKRGSRAPAAFIQNRHDPGIILRRNIFDSSLGDLTQDAVVAGGDVVEGELVLEDGETVNRCTSGLRLTGTAVVPGDFERSLAVIVGSDRKTELYQGAAEVEGSRIRAIHVDAVLLQSGSTGLCRLAMFEPPPDPTGQPRAQVAKPKEPPKKARRKHKDGGPGADRNAGLSDEEIAQGIEKVSDTQYNIRRTLLNKVLDNAGKLIGIAAVAPKMENGQSIGMEIRGIRPKTLLSKLGIQNNDILESVNGESLSSPDAALGAYTTLRTSDKFTLSIGRGGSSTIITYNLN